MDRLDPYWFKNSGIQKDWTTVLGYGQSSAAPWGPYNFQFSGSSNTDTYFHLAATSTDYSVPANFSFATGTWAYITGTYSTGTLRYYVNGIQRSSWTPGSFTSIGNYDATNGLGIGATYSNANHTSGTIDEVRIDNVERSAPWIQTSYNNQNVTSTFMTLGQSQSNQGSTSTSQGLGNSTMVWDYDNRITQVSIPKNSTSTYAYDSFDRRVSTSVIATSTLTTVYPTDSYNITGTTGTTKHLFAEGIMVATINGSATSSQVSYILTDHLSGSSIITNASGTIAELTDYYPYGGVRVDQRNGSVNEQRKFTGHELDASTGLNYMQARYQSGKIGRFLSQDPVFLAVSDNGRVKQLTGKELRKILADPQSLNAYSYARNNPIILVDPNGKFFKQVANAALNTFFSEQDLMYIGAGVEQIYNESAVARTVIDHPYAAGATIGAVGGLAAAGGGALIAAGGAGVGATAASCASNSCQQVQQVSVQTLQLGTRRDNLLQSISNTRLWNIARDLYRSNAQYGDGGTADAARYELETGVKIMGKDHVGKAFQYIKAIRNVMSTQSLNNYDKITATRLYNDLVDAVTKK